MMSTQTATPANPAAPSGARPSYRLTFLGVLRSEFLKFRTLVSSWVLVIVTVVAMIGLGALFAYVAVVQVGFNEDIQQQMESDPQLGGEMAAMPDPMDFALQSPAAGVTLAYLILGALAVVVIASEFGTRSITSTFTAAPKRAEVYIAKAIVIGVYSAVIAVISVLGAWLVAQPILSQEDLTFSLWREDVWFNILGVVVIFVLTAWMGMGLGALVRNNAGAIVILVVLLFVTAIIFSMLPWDWAKDFTQYLPQSLAGILGNPVEPSDATQTATEGDAPGYVEAGLWYAVWCGVPLVAGLFSFTSRDPK